MSEMKKSDMVKKIASHPDQPKLINCSVISAGAHEGALFPLRHHVFGIPLHQSTTRSETEKDDVVKATRRSHSLRYLLFNSLYLRSASDLAGALCR